MAAELAAPPAALLPVLCSAAAVLGLLVSDQRGYRPGRYLCKPLAALAFIWLALALDAPATAYGQWLLAALLACLLGDLLLMPDSERWFLAGLCAFLCGHLLYAAAFLQLSPQPRGLVWSLAPAMLLLMGSARWLLPHVPRTMKLPVGLYMLVITAMLLTAGLTAATAAAWLIIAGAWGFALSDLAVARQQFVQPDRRNGLWGTPLYFLSQMLLAASVGQA